MDYAAEYTKIHEQHPKFFAGMSLKRYVNDLVKIVAEHKPWCLLDYGSGKGYQYLKARYHERWGGLLPICFDIGVRQLSDRPLGKFDGIINTDMMEHIDEKDVPRILDDILSFSTGEHAVPDAGMPTLKVMVPSFVFFAISCVPDDKPFRLSDGRGVHVTLKDPAWWRARINEADKRRDGPPPTIYYVFDTATGGERGVIK